MGGQAVLILCVSVISAVLGNHMQGGSMSFRAREKYSNGWVVDFKYKTAFTHSTSEFYWSCLSGNCGTVLQDTKIPMENKTSNPIWYQNEGYMKRRVSIDKPFQLRESSCCWADNVNTNIYGGWELVTAVDLGTRSDTKKPNTSPVTSFIPILRIPRNCATSIQLLAHDPDGDLVTCRYGYYYGECGVCSWHFSVDENSCTISFPSGKNTGVYVMEMVLEDFPTKNIHLTYYDRTVTYKYSPSHRKTREAPKKAEKYWYWYSTISDESTQFTDLVTDVSTTNYDSLATSMSARTNMENYPETAEYFYTTEETPTEESIRESTILPTFETYSTTNSVLETSAPTTQHPSTRGVTTGSFVETSYVQEETSSETTAVSTPHYTMDATIEYSVQTTGSQETALTDASTHYTTEATTEYSVQTTGFQETTLTDATTHYTTEPTTEYSVQTTGFQETTLTDATTHYTTEPTTEYSVQTTGFQETTLTDATTHYTTEATTEYSVETSGFQETTLTDATPHYTTEATTEYLVETTVFQETTLPDTTLDTVSHFYTTETTTGFQETTSETEAVTFPYETTGWDSYTTGFPLDYTNVLSRIPLQFLVEATNPVPACAYGEYRPRFLTPTPIHGTKLLVNAGKIFQLHLTAHAAYERIADFKVSGLPGMTKTFKFTSKSDTRSMVVEWTPKDDNVGEHVPVCFVAETTNGYQSELRCVVVVVGPSKLDSTLLCHENTMTLIISKTTNPELDKMQFRLNDPTCLVSSNSTHIIASVAYNSCGTVTEETAEHIVFKNTVSDYDTSLVITRENGISIPFNCSFPKKNRVSASFRAQKADYVFAEAGFGNFTYKFQFYTDSQFVQVNTISPLEVILKEILYMEIQVSSTVPNVELFVESCKATPHDNPSDPIFYDIIQNGCIKDNTLVVYPGSRTQYRFAMEAFTFIGDYPEVYINCIVILCKTGTTTTRCTQGCITKSVEASSRHRRSLVSESQQHFISQGPLTMKKETPAGKAVKETSAVNGNTLVIALSGMATVAMISVTLNIYMKRARAAGYQRLNTQDF